MKNRLYELTEPQRVALMIILSHSRSTFSDNVGTDNYARRTACELAMQRANELMEIFKPESPTR